MTALFCATEEGNVQGLQELLDSVTSLDINQRNKVITIWPASISISAIRWIRYDQPRYQPAQ